MVVDRALRSSAVLAAGVAAAGLLAGCGGTSGGQATAGSSSAASVAPAASSSSGSVTGSALTRGLLPAEAFGSQATVVGLTLEQLRAAAGGLGAGSGAGTRIDPPACAVAAQSAAPSFATVDDLAAQSANGPDGATVEALLTGGPAKAAVDRLDGAVAACPQATVTTPQGTTMTLTFESVPVGSLGDGAAAAQITTRLTKPDGTEQTVPTLLAVVQDHGRLLLLITAATNGVPPDRAGFTALLHKAYTTQAHALD